MVGRRKMEVNYIATLLVHTGINYSTTSDVHYSTHA